MRSAVILSLVLTLFALSVTEADGREVTVTGEGVIIDGDVATARSHALTDARVRALEQAAGVLLDAQTRIDSELFTASSVQVRARGAILEEEILSEREEGGLYHLRLRAKVSRQRLADELVRLVEADRVVVAVALTEGEPDGLSRVRAGLAEALRTQGYQHIVEAEGVYPDGIDQARAVGLRYLAEAVLAVRVDLDPPASQSGGLWVCRARGQARLFRVATREVVAAVAVTDVRGFGDSAARARRSGLERFTEQVSAQLAESLVPDELRTLRVEVLGIPDFASFERVRNLLSSLRWVQEVRTDRLGYHRRKTVFFVQTRLDPVSLGAAVDRDRTLAVEEAGVEGVRVKWSSM